MSEVIFTLSKSITYADKGEELEGKFITLLPPTIKQLPQCTPLKQGFFRAAAEAETRQTKEQKDQTGSVEDMEPENIIQLIYISSEDATKFLLHGIELLKSGIALVDGEQKLTDPLIKQISQDDLEKLLGMYLINFTLASTLANQ